MRGTLNIFLLITGIFTVTALYAQRVAVYDDGGFGAWPDGVSAFEQFLDWKGIDHQRIAPSELNSQPLVGSFDAIYFPGGYAWYYKAAIDSVGLQHIRDLVLAGGGYIGMCAGAYFACDTVDWEEDGLIDYPLNLFDGVGQGALDGIAPWADYTMTTVDLNPAHPINAFEPSQETMLYYGGPKFTGHSGFVFDTVGTWQANGGSPAIISFSYGDGRVLLVGPHPEIEEDSARDSTSFADELDDNGSDWPFLWSAMDWLLQRPVTYPPVSHLSRSVDFGPQGFSLHSVWPNPFNGQAQFSITINRAGRLNLVVLNVLGKRILQRQTAALQKGRHRIGLDLSGQPSGLYLLRVQQYREIKTIKLLLVN